MSAMKSLLFGLSFFVGISYNVLSQVKSPDINVIKNTLKNYDIEVLTPKKVTLSDNKDYFLDKDFYFKAVVDTNNFKTSLFNSVYVLSSSYPDSTIEQLTKTNQGSLFLKYDSTLISEALSSSIYNKFMEKQTTTSEHTKPLFLDDIIANYPNPFNSSTRIVMKIPYESDVNLLFFNILGQKVFESNEEHLSKGMHSKNFEFNLSSGNYFLILEGKNGKERYISTKKMLNIK